MKNWKKEFIDARRVGSAMHTLRQDMRYNASPLAQNFTSVDVHKRDVHKRARCIIKTLGEASTWSHSV